jgi:hypothetical protein
VDLVDQYENRSHYTITTDVEGKFLVVCGKLSLD